MEDKFLDILSRSSLFYNMDRSDIEEFLDGNNYKVERYTKSDVFALSGDKVNHLMIVLEGELIARMVSESGKYIQIDKIDSGRIIAPAMLFASDNVFPVNVIPDSDTSVLFIHKNNFLKAMLQDEQLLHNFIRIVSDINRFLSTRIHSLSLKTIRGKLGEYILQEEERQGGKKVIALHMTKQELADKFAVARQALSRSLSELEEEGMIAIEGRKIIILDKNKLSGLE